MADCSLSKFDFNSLLNVCKLEKQTFKIKAARSRFFLFREQLFNLGQLPGHPTALGIDLY